MPVRPTSSSTLSAATSKKLVGAEGGGTTANHSSFMNVISAWSRRAQIPHRGGHERHPEVLQGLVVRSAYTQVLDDLNLPEEDIWVLKKIIPASSATTPVYVHKNWPQ